MGNGPPSPALHQVTVRRWKLALFLARAARAVTEFLKQRFGILLGLASNEEAGVYSRLGLALSAIFLAFSGFWIFYFTEGLVRWLPLSLVGFGLYNTAVSLRKGVALPRVNALALTGHLSALLAFYLFSTRFLTVVYQTDGIVATYMGIVKTLQGQNPYLYSIKPFLDQFGLPSSFYTPRVDGSYEFHLNYPGLNFLSLLPLYLVGLHDLRDGVLFFHILSILTVFYVARSRLKALLIAPFAFGFPFTIVYSFTDSIWTFFLIMSALYWNRNRRVSLVMFGLSAATKQIAFAALPFLLVRLWHETEGSRLKGLVRDTGLILVAYLIPNLPFVLTSPSSWWSATVVPYLPGTTTMIAGGVGFSGILMNLGVALPASFFTLLAGIVGVGTILLFFLRYQRLRNLMWAMPALVLFFYHRSFPNYLFYWLFPLLVERMLNGPFNLGLNFMPKLAALVPRPSSRPSLGDFIRNTWPSLLLVLAVTTAFAGVSGAYVSQVSASKVEVRINSIVDPDNLGATTMMKVSLTNNGPDPIFPKFFVKPQCLCLPVLWKAGANTTLAGYSQASYLITAIDALAAIARGTQFRVLVYDSKTGDFAGQSKLFSADTPRPSVTNPDFRWWTLDVSTGRQVPYGWKLLLVGTQGLADGLEPSNKTSDSGVQMTLNYTSTRIGPAQLALTQRLLFNETNLGLVAFQPFTTNPGKVILGARVTDGPHLLYFLFSGTAIQESVATYSENTTVTIPIKPFAWSSLVLDTRAIWKTQGWTEPMVVEFSLFIEASSYGYYYSNVQEISQTTS